MDSQLMDFIQKTGMALDKIKRIRSSLNIELDSDEDSDGNLTFKLWDHNTEKHIDLVQAFQLIEANRNTLNQCIELLNIKGFDE